MFGNLKKDNMAGITGRDGDSKKDNSKKNKTGMGLWFDYNCTFFFIQYKSCHTFTTFAGSIRCGDF